MKRKPTPEEKKKRIFNRKNKEEYFLETTGKVTKVLGGSIFYVQCKQGSEDSVVRARISSEYKSNKRKNVSSKIMEGSIVKLKISINDPERGSMIISLII